VHPSQNPPHSHRPCPATQRTKRAVSKGAVVASVAGEGLAVVALVEVPVAEAALDLEVVPARGRQCTHQGAPVLSQLRQHRGKGGGGGSSMQSGARTDTPGDKNRRARMCTHTGSQYQRDTTRHNSTQHNTTQHNTTQHNTTQHNTTQLNTTQHNTTQHNSTQHNTTQHNTTQHNTTQHNSTQHNTTQHNTTQHNTTNTRRTQFITTHNPKHAGHTTHSTKDWRAQLAGSA
jgi:hypothetical protein